MHILCLHFLVFAGNTTNLPIPIQSTSDANSIASFDTSLVTLLSKIRSKFDTSIPTQIRQHRWLTLLIPISTPHTTATILKIEEKEIMITIGQLSILGNFFSWLSETWIILSSVSPLISYHQIFYQNDYIREPARRIDNWS